MLLKIFSFVLFLSKFVFSNGVTVRKNKSMQEQNYEKVALTCAICTVEASSISTQAMVETLFISWGITVDYGVKRIY